MINSYNDDLLSTTWLGEVVDVEDPQKVGRIKVKVYGKFDDIPVENIPWAYPGNNFSGGAASGGGFFSTPKKGSIVSIKFDMGNIYHPEYFFNQKISNEVKEEISDSYTNAHVIVFDTVTEGSLKIFFTEKKGLMLEYKGSQINIKPDKSIDVHTASGKSKIELIDDGTLNIQNSNIINVTSEANINIISKKSIKINCIDVDVTASKKAIIDSPMIELGKGAIESVILGDAFAKIFDTHIHPTPVGPSSPPTSLISKTSVLSQTTKTK